MTTRARPIATRLASDPPFAVAYRLPSDQRSVGRARQILRHNLQSWHVDSELDYVAELLLSELVTNAVNAQAAAAEDVGVRITLSASRLRLEVRDASDELPVMIQAEEDEECGRGLVLVDALASGWGVDRDGIGKIVWAELAVSDASAPRPSLSAPHRP
ncbi:ATP-binding protein [Streptomyces inhibens]|uniref:ATP-binding protein n=1 Tax=Streptomyces inhibens TaxID=2293571 RepID=UPI0037A7320E